MITTYDIFRFSTKEDRLTGQFAYALENTDKSHLLKEFLNRCGVIINSTKDLQFINLQLQTLKDESIPDLVVTRKGEDILFVESKPFQQVSTQQLVNHVKSGRGKVPVVCLTEQRAEPIGIANAQRIILAEGYPEDLIRWMSWKTVYLVLKSLPKNMQDKPEIEGMIRTLEDENLLGFLGFERQELEGMLDFVKKYRNVLNKTEQFMQDLNTYLQEKNAKIESSDYHPKNEDYCFHLFGLENWENCGDTWAGPIGSFVGVTKNLKEGYFAIVVRIGIYTIDKYSRDEDAYIELLDKIERNIAEILGDNYDQFLPVDDAIEFSAKYRFDEEILYIKPDELVRKFGEKLIAILRFLETSGYYEREEYEENEFIDELRRLAKKGKTLKEATTLLGADLKEVKNSAKKGKVKFAK